MAEKKLAGKRVAILAADMFERVELEKPREALEQAGAETGGGSRRGRRSRPTSATPAASGSTGRRWSSSSRSVA